MALVEVVPVHLVDSHSKHGLVFSIHPLLDNAIVEAFVDVDCCGVTVVEDKGVPQGFGTNKVDLVIGEHLEQLLVDGVSFEEVGFDGFSEGGVALDEEGLGAERPVHGLEVLNL